MSKIKVCICRASLGEEFDETASIDEHVIICLKQVFKATVLCCPFKSRLNLKHFICKRFRVVTLNYVAKYLRFARDAIRNVNTASFADKKHRLPFPVKCVIRSPSMSNNHSIFMCFRRARDDYYEEQVL